MCTRPIDNVVFCSTRSTSPLNETIKGIKENIRHGLSLVSPTNIKKTIRELKQKTYGELFVGFFKLFFSIFYYTGFSGYWLVK